MIWHHLLTATVLDAATLKVREGWEVDNTLTIDDTFIDRLHLAEVLARAGAQYDLDLPITDDLLLYRFRARTTTPDPRTGGLILTPDGVRTAWALGDGRTVESIGRTLAIITHPEPGRYTHAITIPGLSHL